MTHTPSDFETYLDQASALELARRSLLGAPVYAVVSLIVLLSTPIVADYFWWAAMEASLLVLLGGIRIWFALGFEHRYERVGERAVFEFSILTALQSLTLGVLAARVVFQYWATQEVVLTVVLAAGCIAAGTSALSVRRSAHLIFLACVLAPLCFSVYLVGGPTKALLILGFLLLMAFLVQDGGQARRIYLQQLKDRFEADINNRRIAVENQARKDFLRDIGHEIRTPATSIIGMTTLLLDENLGQRSREFAEIIRKSSEGLLRLVDNIPGSIHSRPDIQETHIGSFNLSSCIHKVMELYRPQAHRKGIELVSQLTHLPETVIFFDENYLEQVLANILDNAVKFTRHGSVTLNASCREPRDGAMDIEFSVADTGTGIAAQDLESVFDTFSLKGAKTSGKFGGSGLGLPISKGLVELMGGEIWIESSTSKGTTVRFTIHTKLDPSDTSWRPAESILKDPEARFISNLYQDHPHRILVVDDHSVNRRILCLFLMKMGYKVDEATDGQQAVAAAMKGSYDLIFMDIRMPNMNGIEATRWIRQHYDGRKGVRIIALTGDATLETREKCLAAGMDDFMLKPVQVKDLEAILQQTARLPQVTTASPP